MRSTRLSDALEDYFCSECGNGSDGEICERCKGVTIDWSKTDRRWNGETFWQESTQIPEYRPDDDGQGNPKKPEREAEG